MADMSTGLAVWDSSSCTTSMLGKFIRTFKILKEAAEIALIPFLKGAISAALVLLQTAHVGFAITVVQGPRGQELIKPTLRQLGQTARICWV
jgi:hypothetical protein